MKVRGQIYGVTMQAIGNNTYNAAVLLIIKWYYKKQYDGTDRFICLIKWPKRGCFWTRHRKLGFIKGELLSGFRNKSALLSQNYQHAVGVYFDKT